MAGGPSVNERPLVHLVVGCLGYILDVLRFSSNNSFVFVLFIVFEACAALVAAFCL